MKTILNISALLLLFSILFVSLFSCNINKDNDNNSNGDNNNPDNSNDNGYTNDDSEDDDRNSTDDEASDDNESSSGGDTEPLPSVGNQVGKLCITTTIDLIGGGSINVKELFGKTVIVNFWL